MLRFDKATYLSLLLKFILSEKLGNSLWRLDVLLFPEIINIVSILFYNFIELITLLYTPLVVSFSLYKEYMIWQNSLGKFSGVLTAFTCARAIANLCSVCLGVNILSPLLFCYSLKLRIFSTIMATFFHIFIFRNFFNVNIFH